MNFKKPFHYSFISAQPFQTGTPSIPFDGLVSLDTDLNIWQNRAAKLVQPKLEGTSALSQDPYLIRLWTPAPPKMYIHPRRVKERLFAQYTSAHAKGISDDEDEDKTPTGEFGKILANFSERETSIERSFIFPVIRAYKSLERLPTTIDHSDEFQMLPTMIRSVRSCSNLTIEAAVSFDTDHVFTLNETKHQIEARKIVKTQLNTPTPIPTDEILVIPSEVAESIDVQDNLGKKKEITLLQKSLDKMFVRFPVT